MTKRRPAHLITTDLGAVRERLTAILPESTLDELRHNNEDLIAALEDLRQQKERLLLLNAELQETNRGVMALYITGRDVATPPRAALIRKDQLTRERLAFAILLACQDTTR